MVLQELKLKILKKKKNVKKRLCITHFINLAKPSPLDVGDFKGKLIEK